MEERFSEEGETQTVAPLRAGLEIEQMRVKFGGIVAVQSLSMSAPLGQLTGLIGPNGAGKTTTFNVCCGLVRAESGEVRLKGTDISTMGTEQRARLGLGRTFQQIELFDSLTVGENVAMACEVQLAGANPVRQIIGRLGDRERVIASARGALNFCGIDHLTELTAGSLSTGQRRLVELSRCLAGSFDLLLLDEPSSGLDRSETREVAGLLVELVRNENIGIVLVEHDMSLVMEVCDYIYVVDFGQLIFEGTPAEVRNSPIVRKAYLGSELS